MKSQRNTLTWKQKQQLINISTRIQPDAKKRMVCEEIAFIVLMRICRNFCDPQYEDCFQGEAREKLLIDRLKKFRIKYFENII